MDTLFVKEKKSNESRHTQKKLLFDKNTLLLEKEIKGTYNYRYSYDYTYYQEQPAEIHAALEDQLRVEYLNLFYKADSIVRNTYDQNEVKIALEDLGNHQFATKELKMNYYLSDVICKCFLTSWFFPPYYYIK